MNVIIGSWILLKAYKFDFVCLEPHQLPWIHRKIRGDGQDHVSNHVCWMEEHFLDTTQDFIFKVMAATGGCPGLLVTAQETYCYHGSVGGSLMSDCYWLGSIGHVLWYALDQPVL